MTQAVVNDQPEVSANELAAMMGLNVASDQMASLPMGPSSQPSAQAQPQPQPAGQQIDQNYLLHYGVEPALIAKL